MVSLLETCFELRGPFEGKLAGERAMGWPHISLEGGVGDLGDCAVTDPDVSEAEWRGKHHDGVREHVGGPYSGLVDGDANKFEILLGKLGFGWPAP